MFKFNFQFLSLLLIKQGLKWIFECILILRCKTDYLRFDHLAWKYSGLFSSIRLLSELVKLMCEQLFRNLHDVSLSKLTTLGGQFTAEFKVC